MAPGQVLRSLGTVILSIVTLGAVRRKKSKRPGRMEQAVSLFIFLGVGALILSAGWWYVLTIRDTFFIDTPSYELGEVEVIGTSDSAETYKKVLPRLVVAKLTKIRNETNDAVQSLKEARDRKAGNQTLRIEEFVSEKDLPQPFSKPLEIELKVADVDVGPILSLIGNRTRLREKLEITVSIGADGQTANVYGHLPGPQGYAFSETTESSPDMIAEATAGAIIAELVKREEPTLATLGARSYATVLEVLTSYAKHRKIAPILGEARQNELNALNGKLRETAQRFSRWRDLQWLAAEVSEEAGQWEDTFVYYSNLAAITPTSHQDRALIDSKLRTAEVERSKIVLARAKAAERGVDEEVVLQEQAKNNREATSGGVPDDVLAPIRRMIGLTDGIDASGQKIGIVGAPWRETLEDLTWETVGDTRLDNAELGYRDYVSVLVQMVRIVAENPTFVFAPFPAADKHSLGRSMSALVEDPDLDVILYSYGTAVADPEANAGLRKVANAAALVLPAGNEEGPSIYSDVADIALVVGSVDQSGEPAYFSSQTEPMVWAPGDQIPLIGPKSGTLEFQSGTGYSAAIAAGAVAVLRKHAPEADTAAVFSALRQGAKPVEGRNSPAIMNVPGSIKAISEATAEPGSG